MANRGVWYNDRMEAKHVHRPLLTDRQRTTLGALQRFVVLQSSDTKTTRGRLPARATKHFQSNPRSAARALEAAHGRVSRTVADDVIGGIRTLIAELPSDQRSGLTRASHGIQQWPDRDGDTALSFEQQRAVDQALDQAIADGIAGLTAARAAGVKVSDVAARAGIHRNVVARMSKKGKDISNLPAALNAAADLLAEQADQFGDEHAAPGNLRARLLPRIAAISWCLLAERRVMESEPIGEEPTMPERPDWSAVGVDSELVAIAKYEMYDVDSDQEAGTRVAYPERELGLYPERGLGGMMQLLLRAPGSVVPGRSETLLSLADLVTLYCDRNATVGVARILETAEEQLVISLSTYLRALSELVAALSADGSWVLDLPTISVA